MGSLIQDLEYLAREAGESERQRRSREAFDFYLGEQERYLAPNPDETPAEFARRPKATLNLTRLVIDVLSGLYKDPPQRAVFGGDDQPDEALAKRLDAAWYANALDGCLLAVDRCVRTTGAAALRVYYDPDYYGPGRGEVLYWFYPAHLLSGIADPERPWRPLGLVLRWADLDAHGEVTPRGELWTAEQFGVLRGKEIAWEENRLGCIPAVLVRDEPAQGVIGRAGTNLFPRGRGWELAAANRTLNQRLADDLWTIKLQGFGVPVLLNPGPDGAERLALSPGRALAFWSGPDQEAGISFAAPNAPLAELRADVQERIRQILLANRIPEDAIAARLVPGASGVALRATQLPVQLDRDERRRLFERVERELFDLSVRVLNAHEPEASYDEEGWLEVEYPEPAAPAAEVPETSEV